MTWQLADFYINCNHQGLMTESIIKCLYYNRLLLQILCPIFRNEWCIKALMENAVFGLS